jgi:hypothetical protein
MLLFQIVKEAAGTLSLHIIILLAMVQHREESKDGC